MNATAVIIAWVIALGSPVTPSSNPRDHRGPAEVTWSESSAPAPSLSPRGEATRAERPAPAGKVPPPRPTREEKVTIAVGLSPEAPGTKQERQLLDVLATTMAASLDPPTHTRRLRAGAGDARRICRERRDDLVVMIGYLPDREAPVLLAHDCRLDVGLGVREMAAAREPGLAGALWDEHEALVRQGVKERRRLVKLGPGARAGIVAGVALLVIGVAVGVLVANALRDEKVVLKVSP